MYARDNSPSAFSVRAARQSSALPIDADILTYDTKAKGAKETKSQEPSSTHSDDVEISRKGSHWRVVRLISWRLIFLLFLPLILVHTLVNAQGKTL